MKKLKQDDIIKSTLMFWVDDSIETNYENKYKNELLKYKNIQQVTTPSGLRDFIRSSEESIKLLETVLGISGERFKRVITALRVQKGFVVGSEWSEKAIQQNLVRNLNFMNEFCDLFFNQERFKGFIPKSILNEFIIDKDRLNILCSDDVLLKQIKDTFSASYNSTCASSYASSIISQIKDITNRYGLRIEKTIDRNLGYNGELTFISDGDKKIIVTIQYLVTTSNNQTAYAKKIQEIRSATAGKSKYLLVNILDGAGWVARHADFEKIYNDCHYFLNRANIHIIESIVTEFYNIK